MNCQGDSMKKGQITEKEIQAFTEGHMFGLQYDGDLDPKQLEIYNPYEVGSEEYEDWLNGYYESLK